MQNDVDETDLGYLECCLEHGLGLFDCTLVKFNITSVSGVDKQSIPEIKKHFIYCDLSSRILADDLDNLIWVEYEMWTLDRGDFDYLNPEALTYRKEEMLIDYVSFKESEADPYTAPNINDLAYNDISEHATSLTDASLSDCELDCYLGVLEELIRDVCEDYVDEEQPFGLTDAVKNLYDKLLAEYRGEEEKQQKLDALAQAEWSSDCVDLIFKISKGPTQETDGSFVIFFVSKMSTHHLRVELEHDSSDTQSAIAKFTISRKPASSGSTGMIRWRERFYKETNVTLGSKSSEKNTVNAINKMLNSKAFWN